MTAAEEPPHFYKYRSLEGSGDGSVRDRTRRIIADNAVWFARAADVNDPFDCAPGYSLAAPAPVFRKFLHRLFREKAPAMGRHAVRVQLAAIRRDPARQQNSPQLIAEMRRLTAATVNSAGFCSLSTRPDHVLMWSHYAASHTGICLRFSGASWAFPFRAAQRVTYRAERPVLNPVLDDADAIVDKTFLSKADFWAYEEEWRVLSHPGGPVDPAGDPGLVTYEPRALDGVIFGANTSDADIAEVTRWVAGREQPVELLRARPSPDHFRLDIGPL
ncbi:hypothetical protein ROTAS13_03135 [Roseomonas sp. TAS13]|uniref:DUF2971 domain-containing protein n=1 Tax=Roseomonas sp. TAS13 TaxID=1926319 RepID=UPI00095DBC66|nr:DUF2971 domain-containing protein [Roseomonas sp. TAS13]GAV35459.1 hypothetical protein ROTAS13_03135 [Roseomonas sp. TAS13]